MTDAELVRAVSIAAELVRRKSKDQFKTFVRYIKPDYEMEWFHRVICDKLQAFAEGRIKKIMILMPPQCGKSQLATRLLPPYILGKNPDIKVVIASYSDTMVQGFNRDIQRIIDSQDYYNVFPETTLQGSRFVKDSSTYYARNYHEFEIVKHRGSIKTVGRGGALTGSQVDIGIIDDLYKDRSEAKSMTVSQATWEWYTDVFQTRLHNNSQQLIMNTRWDQDDLAGRLIEREGDQWDIIKFPAIKTQDIVDYDSRKEGEVLWPSRHSLQRMLDVKAKNQVTFNSLYQQDPKPNTEILIFPDWIEIPEWPTVPDINGNPVPLQVMSWGLDFGKTTGINALVKHSINGENAYFEEVCYEPGLSSKSIVDLLRHNGYVPGVPVYCDHMPTKIAELRRLQIAAYAAVKGEGSIQAGITKLREFKCHYTKRSVNMRMELANYQNVTYGNVITNIPVDDYNHLLDANRYANYSTSFRQTG